MTAHSPTGQTARKPRPAPGAEAPSAPARTKKKKPGAKARPARESGGPKGPDPTRYGDWERKGRCIDF